MGKHYLLNLYGCSFELLNDAEYLISLIENAAVASGATVVQTIFKKFEPQGFTGICLLSESHISIHTFPEKNSAAVDVFCCGDAEPKVGCEMIIKELNPHDYVLEFHQR
jgi:S-adenosylmethionine decarboxylase